LNLINKKGLCIGIVSNDDHKKNKYYDFKIPKIYEIKMLKKNKKN
jgi:hypothetical protein